MANHPVKTAPAAKLALIVGLALIAITVIVLLNSLINTIEKNSVKGDIDVTAIANNKALMTAKNLQPVGEVTASDGSGVAPSSARSGEEVYKAVCAACHATGAAGAPKTDDKAAWKPRVANGFDALLATAINGKGAMPARAGQNISDEELTVSIAYMVEKAGLSIDIPKAAAEEKKAAAAPEASTATEATPAPEAKKAEEPAVVPATEEKAPATTTAPEVKKVEEVSTATETTPATEEKKIEESAPAAPTIEAKAPEAVTSPVKEKAPTAETKPAAPSAPAAPTKAAAPAQKAETATASNIDAQAIYKTACFACHDTGAANAPKITDKAAWQPRIALGKEVLYTSAIKGKAAMPPKGGNMALSDGEVKAVVDYMVSVAQ